MSSPGSKRTSKQAHTASGAEGGGPSSSALQPSTPAQPFGSAAPQGQPTGPTHSRKRSRSSGQPVASMLAPAGAPSAAGSTAFGSSGSAPGPVAGGGAASGGPALAPVTATPGTVSSAGPEQEEPIVRPAKKGRTNTPWTPAEEQRLKSMRDEGNSWSEIAKSFPLRTEGSVKKHWYKDMHYAEFAADEEAALLAAIKEYEANKWKEIGKRVGKPAKACEQFAKEHFQGKI